MQIARWPSAWKFRFGSKCLKIKTFHPSQILGTD